MASMSFREAEQAAWTARADSYDAVFSALTGQAIPHILAALGDDLAGRALLDVCCGPGHLAAAAAARGARAEGIDFAPTMVARARRNHPTLPFREGDAQLLPHPDACFDAVACAFGVMHLEQPDLAIAEAFRVLRPGGAFAFTQWAMADELLAIVAAAVAAHGRPSADLPPAPPQMRFSEPEECRRTLVAHGFAGVSVTPIALEWRGGRPETALDLIHGGAVRAAMVIEAQAPEERGRINAAILDAVRARRAPDGSCVVRRPTLLAAGRKPAVPTRAGSPGPAPVPRVA
jgi:ubiquinone/menaquinone biosynthesis C-methylase UbiE